MFAAGTQKYLAAHDVLNKHYQDWILAHSSAIVTAADQHAQTTIVGSNNYRQHSICLLSSEGIVREHQGIAHKTTIPDRRR